MNPLKASDLAQGCCMEPGCECDASAGLWIHARCHPEAGLWVFFSKPDNTLEISCSKCNQPIVKIAVSE